MEVVRSLIREGFLEIIQIKAASPHCDRIVKVFELTATEILGRNGREPSAFPANVIPRPLPQSRPKSRFKTMVPDWRKVQNIRYELQVPLFDGRNLKERILEIENYFHLFWLSEEEKFGAACVALDGEAWMWFVGEHLQRPFFQWEELKVLLVLRFGYAPGQALQAPARFGSKREHHEETTMKEEVRNERMEAKTESQNEVVYTAVTIPTVLYETRMEPAKSKRTPVGVQPLIQNLDREKSSYFSGGIGGFTSVQGSIDWVSNEAHGGFFKSNNIGGVVYSGRSDRMFGKRNTAYGGGWDGADFAKSGSDASGSGGGSGDAVAKERLNLAAAVGWMSALRVRGVRQQALLLPTKMVMKEGAYWNVGG